MANSFGFNFFIIILGFCLLGLPIILISLSTAPPSPDQYLSVIEWNYDETDPQALTLLNKTISITGNSSYWDSIRGSAPLEGIFNITALIEQEENFTKYVNTDDYGGFSKKVHVFSLVMTIEKLTGNVSEMIYNVYNELYVENPHFTYMFFLNQLDTYEAHFHAEQNFPNTTATMNDILSQHSDLDYIVYVDFHADIELNSVHVTADFQRLVLLDSSGEPVFFVTNEIGWQTPK